MLSWRNLMFFNHFSVWFSQTMKVWPYLHTSTMKVWPYLHTSTMKVWPYPHTRTMKVWPYLHTRCIGYASSPQPVFSSKPYQAFYETNIQIRRRRNLKCKQVNGRLFFFQGGFSFSEDFGINLAALQQEIRAGSTKEDVEMDGMGAIRLIGAQFFLFNDE